MADLIDRKELRDALYEADAVTMQGVKIINQFPAVDAVPVRHGRWRCHGDCGVTECSVCGWSIEEYVGNYAYCPNCGARMDEEVKHEN